MCGMASTRIRVWPRWLFRAAITCEAVLAFGQAFLAGGFLAGHYDLLAMHQLNASVTGVTEIAVVVTAVLWWRFGGGPGRPIAVSAGLFGAEVVQIMLGYGRVLAIRVPLGVALVVGITMLLVWAWRGPVREGA